MQWYNIHCNRWGESLALITSRGFVYTTLRVGLNRIAAQFVRIKRSAIALLSQFGLHCKNWFENTSSFIRGLLENWWYCVCALCIIRMNRLVETSKLQLFHHPVFPNHLSRRGEQMRIQNIWCAYLKPPRLFLDPWLPGSSSLSFSPILLNLKQSAIFRADKRFEKVMR